MLRSWFGLTLILVSVLCSCSRPRTETAQQAFPLAETAGLVPSQAPAESTSDVMALPTEARKTTGDLDALREGRTIRVVVPLSKTQFYVVNGVKRGLCSESGMAFQKYLDRTYTPRKKHLKTHVIFQPVPRDALLSHLNDGTADIAIAGLTITPERHKFVDLYDPVVSGINEIAVTGPDSPELASLDDLSGKDVYLRKSSS